MLFMLMLVFEFVISLMFDPLRHKYNSPPSMKVYAYVNAFPFKTSLWQENISPGPT